MEMEMKMKIKMQNNKSSAKGAAGTPTTPGVARREQRASLQTTGNVRHPCEPLHTHTHTFTFTFTESHPFRVETFFSKLHCE